MFQTSINTTMHVSDTYFLYVTIKLLEKIIKTKLLQLPSGNADPQIYPGDESVSYWNQFYVRIY